MPLKKIVVIGPESTGKSTLCMGLAAHFKSTHFKTDWVPEYAREYLLAHGTAYTWPDLLTIAKGQLAGEDEKARGLELRYEGGGQDKSEGSNEDNSDAGNSGDDRGKGNGDAAEDGGSGSGQRSRDEGSTGEGGGGNSILFIDTDMYVMKVWSEYVFGRCDPWILEQIVTRKYDGYLLCRTDLPWVADELREYPDLANREKLFHIYKDCLINQSVPWAEIGGQSAERLQNAIDAAERLLH